MKLLRLSLQDWRAVASREVVFADGVTLIEGPNEIGKSTIVEAIRILFDEMDSSNKKRVKAIQPVGQDVGSRVELELVTGAYHFVYRKTYNKGKQTELNILAPRPEQLTGREAHERAAQILDETVDRGLWNALLVEQGKEIAGAHLADSAGLARALDEAAGTASGEIDDTALLDAAQVEYGQYFTPATGRPRYGDLEQQVRDKRAEAEALASSLAEVEADSDEHQRVVAEIRRLEGEAPGLESEVAARDATWRAIASIKNQLASRQSELESARQLQRAAEDDRQRRRHLMADLKKSAGQMEDARQRMVNYARGMQELKQRFEQADLALKEAKSRRDEAREILDRARADEQHLRDAGALQAVRKQLQRLDRYNEELAACRGILSAVKIDLEGVEALREAETALQVATAKRDAVATAVSIEARDDIAVSLGGEQIELAAGCIEERQISSQLELEIPMVALIRVTPSQSAGELEAEVGECRTSLSALFTRYGVESLADAIAAEAKRSAAARDVDARLKEIEELLEGEDESERRSAADELALRCESYLAGRAQEPAMADTVEKAAAATEAAQAKLRESEAAVEREQAARDELRDQYNAVNAEQRVAGEEVAGWERTGEDQRSALEAAREDQSDRELDVIAEERAKAAEVLQGQCAELELQLESASPDTAEMLLENSRDTLARARRDLQTQNTRLAVLEDRLSKAQADGRFEALEAAAHDLQALEADYAATLARAAAAKRLWETLNKYRDIARKAYAAPLKDGIERLGKIVFGPDFEVELGDDWELLSRTRNGKTIAFDQLSVGAREQLGILTRLAAARIVSSQGGVPLIIDDALGFSDPARLQTMGAAIASAGRDCQVILLTCTPGRFTHVGSAEVVRF